MQGTDETGVDEPSAPPTRSRRRIAAFAALAVGAVALIAVAATGGFSDSSSTAARSASNSTATTTIRRQDLVEVDSESGTLGYGDARDVVNRLSGTVTWLPQAGATIRPDGTLYKVDATPVVLLNGSRPAYRTLSASSSASGRDVAELELDLRALGYDDAKAMTLDDTWDSGTTAAVELFQKAHGLDQTGSLDLGRVVFLPGAHRIGTVSATLGGSASSGASGGGSSSAGSTTTASTTTGTGQARDAVLFTAARSTAGSETAVVADVQTTPTTPTTPTTTPTTTTPTTTTPTTPTTTTPTKPTTPTKTAPSRAPTTPSKTTAAPSAAPSGGSAPAGGATSGGGAGSSGSATSSGSAATAANTLMTTTDTRRQVTVNLATTKQALAKTGARVTVELPGNTVVPGRITSVGKVATAPASSSSSGGGSSGSTDATITVLIRLTSTRGSALDQAPVTVRFEQSRVKNVLAVPVTALIAQPGGRFAVDVVSGGTHRLVAVEPGLYTSGFVQITGSGLQPGMTVTNASETA